MQPLQTLVSATIVEEGAVKHLVGWLCSHEFKRHADSYSSSVATRRRRRRPDPVSNVKVLVSKPLPSTVEFSFWVCAAQSRHRPRLGVC
jgi:hypothetical protein